MSKFIEEQTDSRIIVAVEHAGKRWEIDLPERESPFQLLSQSFDDIHAFAYRFFLKRFACLVSL